MLQHLETSIQNFFIFVILLIFQTLFNSAKNETCFFFHFQKQIKENKDILTPYMSNYVRNLKTSTLLNQNCFFFFRFYLLSSYYFTICMFIKTRKSRSSLSFFWIKLIYWGFVKHLESYEVSIGAFFFSFKCIQF